jgi:UDP-N-acetylenolpyruvoylglucosamine reductase
MLPPLPDSAVDLAPLTTVRVPARARRFIEVRSLDDVRALAWQAAGGPIFPLGGGENRGDSVRWCVENGSVEKRFGIRLTPEVNIVGRSEARCLSCRP